MKITITKLQLKRVRQTDHPSITILGANCPIIGDVVGIIANHPTFSYGNNDLKCLQVFQRVPCYCDYLLMTKTNITKFNKNSNI
jgi:hypothetical protein